MLSGITHSITLGTAELGRALDIRAMGFRDADSLHLACAESGGVDVLLTVDDQLVRTAARHAQQLHVRVENPVTWLREQSDQ
jgi:predicted nucleic acid-binding protein